eukprot:snap_masked-scaffold_23-processed-gene-2.14-mRNA-1 protein AED:1.00 eAED:1.00 QI:0/-1/0/0/-1/1/1/0/146
MKYITKYQLSIQRVKNVLAQRINKETDLFQPSKYNLKFEKELIDRVWEDKEFKEYYAKKNKHFKSNNLFLRSLDFGGQEIFSSVHHIFMNPNAVYIIVFNLIKLSVKDLERLKFWCESVLKNTREANIIFVGAHLNTIRKNINKKD